MASKVTFDLSAFKQQAALAVAIIRSIDQGTEVDDLTPVRSVSVMLKGLRLSKPKEFAAGLEPTIVGTLRNAAGSVRARYAEPDALRNFLGEIAGITGKMPNPHVDYPKRLRVRQFLEHVIAT